MTSNAQWDAMTPRERDAMVAEVFGWVVSVDRKDPMGNPEGKRYPNGAAILQRAIPAYTSTWPGFGLVVERMRELGWCLVLLAMGAADNHKWHADWSQGMPVGGPDDMAVGSAAADSAPAATALAAVRAREGDVG